MTRARRGPARNPNFYNCGNPACKRTTPLALKYYMLDPGPDVDESVIHRVVDTSVPGFSIHCNCGHFTVVRPYIP